MGRAGARVYRLYGGARCGYRGTLQPGRGAGHPRTGRSTYHLSRDRLQRCARPPVGALGVIGTRGAGSRVSLQLWHRGCRSRPQTGTPEHRSDQRCCGHEGLSWAHDGGLVGHLGEEIPRALPSSAAGVQSRALQQTRAAPSGGGREHWRGVTRSRAGRGRGHPSESRVPARGA